MELEGVSFSSEIYIYFQLPSYMLNEMNVDKLFILNFIGLLAEVNICQKLSNA